jgi:hypothetical protein
MGRLAFSILAPALCLAAHGVARADETAAIDLYFSIAANKSDRSTLHEFAYCTVGRHPADAQEMVRKQGTDEDLLKHSATLVDGGCLKAAVFKSKRARLSAPVYLPVLAEALLVRDYAASNLPSVNSVEPLEHPSLPDVDISKVYPRYRSQFEFDWALHRLDVLGECVARADPQAVFSLSKTEHDSAEEDAVLGSLQGTISSCNGTALGFKPQPFVWRGALVMNLYRLVDAARPVAHEEVKAGA